MTFVEKCVQKIIEEYGVLESDIQVDMAEGYTFYPEDLEDVTSNKKVLEKERLVETIPFNHEGKEKYAHVIADVDTYEILEVVSQIAE